MTDQQHPQNRPAPEEEVHLSDYINVVARRRKGFLLVFLGIFLGVAVYTFVSKPIYEAWASLHVNDDKGKQGILSELALLNSANPIDSEIEILKSRTNMEEVVRRLNLDRRVLREEGAPSLRVLECDCSDRANTQTFYLTFDGAESFSVADAEHKTIASGKKGVPLQVRGLRLVVGETTCRRGDVASITLLPFQETVDKLREQVKAVEIGKKTNVIQVSYRSKNPALARDVVNTLVQVYLERTVGYKAEEASKTVSFIEDQLKGLRDDLDRSTTNLQVYKSANGIISLDGEAQTLLGQISDAEKDRSAAALMRKQAEFALASLRDAGRRGIVYTPAVMQDDPGISTMAGRLADLQVQKKALLSQQTEKHPEVKAVQAQIEELQRKIQDTYQSAIQTSAAQESAIKQRLGGYEGRLKKLPAAERDLARLERISKVDADIYTLLLNKREEARVARAATISNINVVDPAIAPDEPIKPKKKKNLLLGLLLGCMAGVGYAFFRDYMDDTIKDPEQAKRVLGLPVLSVIPLFDTGENGAIDPITIAEPKSPGAEAFRSLRTALHFASVDQPSQVLLVTSSFPAEGKSTVSSNLGVLFAQNGARVLLIDCDLRRPSLHTKFSHSKVPGLTEIISGDVLLADAVHATGVSGLDFISAGTIPPNPADLLGSDPMRRLMAEARGKYDRIIVDAPPILAVTDTPVLTSLVDQGLIVMEAERVPVKAAQRMREILQSTGMRLAGFVFNDRMNRGNMYGYGYYGYGYYGYYSDEPAPGKTETRPLWQRIFRG